MQKKKILTPKQKKEKKKLRIAKKIALDKHIENTFTLSEMQRNEAINKHVITIANNEADEKVRWIQNYPKDTYFFINTNNICNVVAMFISNVYITNDECKRRIYLRELTHPIIINTNKFSSHVDVDDIEQMRSLIK